MSFLGLIGYRFYEFNSKQDYLDAKEIEQNSNESCSKETLQLILEDKIESKGIDFYYEME